MTPRPAKVPKTDLDEPPPGIGHNEPPPLDRFLDFDQVEEAVGLGRQRIRDLVVAGLFPQPIRVTSDGRRVAWLASEIQVWLAEAARTRRVEWRRGVENPVQARKLKAARNKAKK